MNSTLKDKLIGAVMAIAFVIALSLAGCSTTDAVSMCNKNDVWESRFITVDRIRNATVAIVYDKESGVMYAISNGPSNHGTVTLLVNQDGTPLLYEDGDY